MGIVGKKRSRASALGVREQPSRNAKNKKSESSDNSPPRKKRKISKKVATPRITRKKTSTPTRRTPSRKAKITKRKTPKKSPKVTKRRKSTPKRKAKEFIAVPPTSPPKPKRILPKVPEDDEVYWKDWKQIFLVGTEWENYDGIYDIEWDFDHLNEDLLEGYLSKSPNPKYIFGTTESFEMAPDPSKPSNTEVYLFPVITVIDCIVPPPAKVGITSVQRGEEIKDMKDLKMEWTPYYRRSVYANKQNRSKIFFLSCTQRKPKLGKLDVNHLKEYEYAIPYIWFPKNDLKKDFDTDVHIITEIGGRGLNFSFDWTFDELDEMINELLSKDEKEKYGKDLEQIIKDKVNERRKEIKEEKEMIKNRIACLTDKERESLDNLKAYKYYPQNDHYPIERSSFINRYYGKATQVFPPVQAAIDYSYLKEIIPTTTTTDKISEDDKKE